MITTYSTVAIRKMLRPSSEYDGWKLNHRAPAVGDVGTVVDILKSENGDVSYIVERSRSDGTTDWLGDFSEAELDPHGT